MQERTSFAALRERAFQLADTGRFADWREIGAEIELEGDENAEARLRIDPVLKLMINARCDQAKDKL